MDRGAIDRLIEAGEEREVTVLAPRFDQTGVYFVRTEEGGYDKHEAPVMPSPVSFADTDSLARFANTEADMAAAVEVFANSDFITARISDDVLRRGWTVGMPLPRHPAFSRLTRLARTEAFTQRTLIRLLRAEFNGHVNDAIIERFRTLKLTVEGGGQSVQAQGRAAVDKRIQQAIADERGAEIPDEITVTVPVYDLDETRNDLRNVTVLVECLPDEDGRASFELTTVLTTLRDAEAEARDVLLANLRATLSDTIPVYLGETRD